MSWLSITSFRRLALCAVGTSFLVSGCSESKVEADPLGPEDVPPAFHETGDIHADMVKVGHPYPGGSLLWIVGGLAQNVPNVSQAANGHTIDIRGVGPFTTEPDRSVGVTVSSFTWWDETGAVVASGTWTPTRFISYRTYGQENWIPFFGVYAIGGLMIMEIELSTGQRGILRIDCLIGKHPPAAAEGIELALRGGPNFQKEVTGGTVFARFP